VDSQRIVVRATEEKDPTKPGVDIYRLLKFQRSNQNTCITQRPLVKVGDMVSAGDIVAEIETDKTTFEITAPVAGTVLETFFDEGALVKVFAKLFVIGEPGETAAPVSPRARRLASEHNVDLAAVTGSGPGGRVLERDVKRAHAAVPQAPPSSNLRSTIARRMRESLATTAQYTLHSSANAAALLAVRARVKAAKRPPDITINDLITLCAVKALIDVPALNAEYINGRIVTHREVHIAFAVDTPRGLMAPVIRNAHALSIDDLAVRMKELATKAVEGTIAPDDLSGATFTISNLGGLGIESFTPLINVPQVAILGVGAIQLKPVRAGERVEFVDSIGLSLTCDHQVIDGAPGARFLDTLRKKIQGVEALVTI